eukprot:4094189-Ditylum_brightwellii.AAC.1
MISKVNTSKKAIGGGTSTKIGYNRANIRTSMEPTEYYSTQDNPPDNDKLVQYKLDNFEGFGDK